MFMLAVPVVDHAVCRGCRVWSKACHHDRNPIYLPSTHLRHLLCLLSGGPPQDVYTVLTFALRSSPPRPGCRPMTQNAGTHHASRILPSSDPGFFSTPRARQDEAGRNEQPPSGVVRAGTHPIPWRQVRMQRPTHVRRAASMSVVTLVSTACLHRAMHRSALRIHLGGQTHT